MNYFDAIILGLVQGVTEFIPVSSSGHLALTRAFLGIDSAGLLYDVLLHLATLVAVLIYFRKKLLNIILHPKKEKKLITALAVATLPTVAIGFFFAGAISDIENSYPLTIPIALLLTATIFIVSERIHKKKNGEAKNMSLENVGPRPALLIGLAQSMALLPGVSRSGMSIVAGFTAGFSRKDAGEFSFLLSIPAIVGAGGYLFISTINDGGTIPISLPMVAGVIAAAISGYLAIAFMLKHLQKNTFIPFAIYLLIAGSALLIFELLK